MKQHTSDMAGVQPLLTPAQVEEILSVSPRTRRRLGASGRLTRVWLGHRTVRYTPDSVAALIAPQNDDDRATNAVAAKENRDATAITPTG